MSVIFNDFELIFNLHVSSKFPLFLDFIQSLIELGVKIFVHYARFLNELEQLRVRLHPLRKRLS